VVRERSLGGAAESGTAWGECCSSSGAPARRSTMDVDADSSQFSHHVREEQHDGDLCRLHEANIDVRNSRRASVVGVGCRRSDSFGRVQAWCGTLQASQRAAGRASIGCRNDHLDGEQILAPKRHAS
jgi:hypothetical protein